MWQLPPEGVCSHVRDAGHLTTRGPQVSLQILVIRDPQRLGLRLIVQVAAADSFQVRGDGCVDGGPGPLVWGLRGEEEGQDGSAFWAESRGWWGPPSGSSGGKPGGQRGRATAPRPRFPRARAGWHSLDGRMHVTASASRSHRHADGCAQSDACVEPTRVNNRTERVDLAKRLLVRTQQSEPPAGGGRAPGPWKGTAQRESKAQSRAGKAGGRGEGSPSFWGARLVS